MSSNIHPSGRTDDELRRALRAAMADLAEAVDGLGPGDWDRPSPCEGWTIADVVDHVIMGDVFTVAVLSGATLDEAVAGLHGLGDDRSRAGELLAEAAHGARDGFDRSLDTVVHHVVGDISARQFLGYRVLDQLGHAWDVRRGSGQAEALDATALEVAIDVAVAELPTLRASDNFATTADTPIADGADRLRRFLDLLGR